VLFDIAFNKHILCGYAKTKYGVSPTHTDHVIPPMRNPKLAWSMTQRKCRYLILQILIQTACKLWCKNIAEKFNVLSTGQQRYRQQTNGRPCH